MTRSVLSLGRVTDQHLAFYAPSGDTPVLRSRAAPWTHFSSWSWAYLGSVYGFNPRPLNSLLLWKPKNVPKYDQIQLNSPKSTPINFFMDSSIFLISKLSTHNICLLMTWLQSILTFRHISHHSLDVLGNHIYTIPSNLKVPRRSINTKSINQCALQWKLWS